MYKTVVLSAIIALLSFTGCKKKKDKDPCNDIYCDWPVNPFFHFNFKDKATGQDLFYSTPPIYPFSALSTAYGSNGMVNIYMDTINGHHDLLTSVFGLARDTFYFNIAGTRPDTLMYSATFYQVSCCTTGAVLTNMRFDGQLVAARFDTGQYRDSVLNFYK